MKRLSQAPWILLAGAAVAFLLAELLLFPSDASGWLHFGLGATLITSVGAVALAQYRLRRESERYQAVTRIQREFTDLPSEEIIDHIIQFLAELIPQAEKCVLHMLDEENQRLYPRYASQRNNGLRTGMPADRGIAGQAIKTRRTILRNHVTEDSDFLPLDSNSQLRSLIVGPLYFGDQPLGTISLNSSRRNAFGERDRLILAAFARQASIALHQERLLAARQADHDALAAVTRNLDEAFLILDGDQRILQHNAALARILGADMEPLTGKQLSVTSDDEKIRRLAYIIGDISDEKSRHWEKTIHLEEPVPLTLRIQDQKLTKDGGDGRRVILLYDQSHRHQALREQAAILRGLAIEMGADSTGSLTERGIDVWSGMEEKLVEEHIAAFMRQTSAVRNRLGRDKEYDLRPLVYQINYLGSQPDSAFGAAPRHRFEMLTRCGSQGSGRPEEIIDELNIPFEHQRICRTELIWKET